MTNLQKVAVAAITLVAAVTALGAWWEAPPNRLIEVQSCGLWLDGNQLCEPMALTRDQWCAFVAAVLAFGRDDPNRRGITDRISGELLTAPQTITNPLISWCC